MRNRYSKPVFDFEKIELQDIITVSAADFAEMELQRAMTEVIEVDEIGSINYEDFTAE